MNSAKEKDFKRQKIQKELEMEGCTFHPKINE
jgi:hypothetical protein